MKKFLRASVITLSVLTAFPTLHHPLMAQDSQKRLTLDRVMPGGKDFRSFYPQSLYSSGWIGHSLVTYDAQSGYKSLLAQDAKSGRTSTLISLSDLTTILKPYEDLSFLNAFPGHSITPRNQYMRITLNKGVYLIDAQKKTLVRRFDTRGHSFTFTTLDLTEKFLIVKTTDGLLGYLKEDNNEIIRIEQDLPNTEVVYGEAVHQREFGIESGVFPNLQGTKIAFYRMDQSMVAPYPLVNMEPHKAELVPLRYPMAGEPSHHVTVGIYDMSTQETIYLKTEGDPEHYLTNIAWHPDGKTIYIAELNREQNHMQLNAYNATNGIRIKTLFEEQDEKYVEPIMPMHFVPGSQGKQFVWLSRKGGYNNFYLYDTNGKQLKSLAHGTGEVSEFLGFNAQGTVLYYMGTHQSPLEQHLYAHNLKNNKATRLTPVDATHSVLLTADKKYVFDTYSSHSIPRIASILNEKGKELHRLLTASNPDDGYNMPQIEKGILKAADGITDLHYRLVKPMNIKKGKKYPVIIYVYGGPHAQLVTNTWHWGAGGWDLYMAQEGYAVLTLDNRGSANRGKAFEQVIHRNVGIQEMADQMQGVAYLKSLPWIDTNRIGVHGWSFGGFMTTNLMLTHSDIFKVGVAGGPVMDWSRYEVMYGERYNDAPQNNSKGYEANNLTLRAKDLKGRLMLIHGTVDNVVLWQHGQAFVKACVDARTHPDCMFYPGYEHNVIGPDRVHLYETIARYFKDFL